VSGSAPQDFRVLAVVPAYNEERAVATVIEAVLDRGLPLLVVDDASKDRTEQVARQACVEHPRSAASTVIRHPVNKGKGGAVHTALRFARERGYTHVLVIDADGQHDPAEIPRFTEALRKTGADIVLGSRMRNPKGMPIVRLVSNRFSSLLISVLAGRRITDSQSGYRLMSIRVWDGVRVSTQRYEAESEFLVKACRQGFKYVEVPISTIYADETSTFHPVIDTMRFFGLAARLAGWLAFGRRHSGNP
jgi:glycosyltransferase involved in cell wall biosynthesis